MCGLSFFSGWKQPEKIKKKENKKMKVPYFLTGAFWPVKEIKNQALHITASILISFLIYLIFSDIPVSFIGVLFFALGMELDHYAKNPSKEKMIDCIRDFCFYLLGFFIFWGIV